MTDIQQLIARKKELDAEREAIREQLDALHKEEWIAEARAYVGRCFIESKYNNDDHTRIVFVHGVDERSANAIGLGVGYSYGHYSLVHDDLIQSFLEEEESDWTETTREEFDNLYFKALAYFNQLTA